MRESRDINIIFHGNTRLFLFSVAVFSVVMSVLSIANINMFYRNQFLSGDLALDILLIEQGREHWLLTGHHTSEYFRFDTEYGLYHLGPFFLDVRLLGELLFENLTGSRFGGQLIGIFLCAAMFSCLLASLILRLLLRQGAQYKIAVSAAIVATILVVIEINATQS